MGVSVLGTFSPSPLLSFPVPDSRTPTRPRGSPKNPAVMPSRFVLEEDRYDIDAYNDRLYDEMAMRASFQSARPVAVQGAVSRGVPVPEEDEGDGGAYEEEEEYEDEEEEEEDEEEDEEYEEEEEERGGVEMVAGDCEPPLRARASGASAAAGAAVETSNTSTCPVCMEPWTSQGPHRISCIPCGHVYGRSCLEKWLTKNRNQSAKCPQCSKRFKQKDIINLFAQEVAIPARSQLMQEISYLREQIGSLKKKVVRHDKMFEEMTKRQNDMEQGIVDGVSSKRQKVGEHSYEAANRERSIPATISFSLQNELPVDGARVINIDASNQKILVSGRATAIGAEYVLTQINMLSNYEERKIHLPPDTKAVRDMCVLPDGSVIFTSLGKKLSLFSMATDSVALNWDLPAPGWSCAVGPSGSRHIYAGLQNGMVLVFDIRQTGRPLHSMVGLSTNPVHTLHSVIDNGGSRKVLSASAIGPCMWDADNNQSRPYLLPGTGDERVCISLACAAPSSDPLVASFRPKVDASADVASSSQVCLSQTPKRSGSGKLGHHTLIRRTGSMCFTEAMTWHASVSELRMSKSAIIPYGDNQHLFAYGDESLRGVRTWKLPSFEMHSDLCIHREPILDLRYAETGSPGGGRYLGCLSEEKLQVFRVN